MTTDDDRPDVGLGKAIELRRIELGLKRRELAERARLSYPYISEIENGVYTGRLVGSALHGKAKADAVRALAEREGLDLVRCTAYSDSANDVPMLSAVGRAVAVNPDGALRKHARAVGWEIHDYRRTRMNQRYYVPAALAAAAGLGIGAGLGIAAAKKK